MVKKKLNNVKKIILKILKKEGEDDK